MQVEGRWQGLPRGTWASPVSYRHNSLVETEIIGSTEAQQLLKE